MINPFAVCSSIYKMPVFYSLLHGPNRDDKTQNIFTQNWAASSPHLKPLPLSFHAQFHVQQTKNIWGIIGVNMTVTVNDNGWLDHKWWKIYPKKPHRPDQLVVVVTQECDSFCRYHLSQLWHGTHWWNREPQMWGEKKWSHMENTSLHVGKCAWHLREISSELVKIRRIWCFKVDGLWKCLFSNNTK